MCTPSHCCCDGNTTTLCGWSDVPSHRRRTHRTLPLLNPPEPHHKWSALCDCLCQGRSQCSTHASDSNAPSIHVRDLAFRTAAAMCARCQRNESRIQARRLRQHGLCTASRTSQETSLDVDNLDDRCVADSVECHDAVTLCAVPCALCVLDCCCEDLVRGVGICGAC